MSQSRTILHPTDFSKHSDLAFALACSLASGSRLLVLHVMPIPKLHTKRYYREEMEGALRRRQAAGGARWLWNTAWRKARPQLGFSAWRRNAGVT